VSTATQVDAVPTGPVEDLLDELRLSPAWAAVRAAAACQALATALADHLGVRFDADTLSAAAAQIWADRGVDTTDALAAWMQQRGLDEARVRALVVGEAYRRWGEAQVAAAMTEHVLEQLEMSPAYPCLRARAADKRAQLRRRGLDGISHALDLSYQELLTWWTRHRPHLAPARLAEDAAGNPFPTRSAFLRAMIDEYHYVTRCHPDDLPVTSRGNLCDDDIVSRPCRWT
jgi:hypothetical protein